MAEHKSSLRNKIILALILPLAPLLVTIAIYNFIELRNRWNISFDDFRLRTETSLRNSLEIADAGFLAVENVMLKNLHEDSIFIRLCQMYRTADGDIAKMNIDSLVKTFDPKHHIVTIRIVDSSTTIVKSNDGYSTGIRFDMLGTVIRQQIKDALKDSVIYRTRTRRNVEAGRLSSYFFVSTRDHKYLLQVEINPEFVEDVAKRLDFSEMAKRLAGSNPLLENISIYDDVGTLIGSGKNIDIRKHSLRWKGGKTLVSTSTSIGHLIPEILENNGRIVKKDPDREKMTEYILVSFEGDKIIQPCYKIAALTYNKSVIIAELKKNSVKSVFFIALLITVIFIVVIIVVRSITRPLHLVTENVRRIASEKDFTRKIMIDSNDEIGVFVTHFNQMADVLKEHIGKLEEYSQSLEKMVAERTERILAQKEEIERKSEEISKKNEALSSTNVELKSALAEIKTMQIQLIESEKMAFLGNLAAGMAHEINNPIGVISSTIDVIERCGRKMVETVSGDDCGQKIIQDKMFQKSIAMLHTSTETITTATARITKIVSSLKNFVRLDEAEYQKTDIHEGIESTIMLLQDKLDQKIKIIKKFGSIPEITCYPHMLNQIFMVLMKRSVLQCNGEGCIEVVTEADGDQMMIVLSNDGTPMTAKEREQLFDMNLKPGKSRVTFDMEFASVLSILQRHNGSITVEQNKQWGNIFRILLPVSGD